MASDPAVNAHLNEDRLKSLFEPENYQGASQTLIDRLLASLGPAGAIEYDDCAR
jgi:3-carboxy-cis,cis-muconate cycloisomerase